MEKYADVYQTPGAFSWCDGHPTVGRFAVLQDPQGEVIDVMAYGPGG